MSYGHALGVLASVERLARDPHRPDWLSKDYALHRPDTSEMIERGWLTPEGEVTELGRAELAKTGRL